jgi:hypothetical protein
MKQRRISMMRRFSLSMRATTSMELSELEAVVGDMMSPHFHLNEDHRVRHL